MNLPGFTADVSLYKSRQHLMGTHTDLSKNLSGVYPAKLIDENAGVNCNTCVGGQCAELGCLGQLIDGGGIVGPWEPCLSSSSCTDCIPTGPSIFSGGRRFCIESICSPGIGGSCHCQVFKGWRSCRLPPLSVFTPGIRR